MFFCLLARKNIIFANFDKSGVKQKLKKCYFILFLDVFTIKTKLIKFRLLL